MIYYKAGGERKLILLILRNVALYYRRDNTGKGQKADKDDYYECGDIF